MITDTIHQKYIRSLRRVATAHVHIDTVALVLSLALEELADTMQAQSAEVVELRSQLAQLDADNATLITRNKELTTEIERLHADGRKRIRKIANGEATR